MKKTNIALAVLTLTFSSLSQAEFVTTDLYFENDRKATLDTDTGLEWLDLTETFDKSYDQVVSELDTTYAGFRLPTLGELTSMLERYLGEQYNTPLSMTHGNNQKIAGGRTDDYSTGGGAQVLSAFNRTKSNFGGSLCSISGSYCSTYSSQASNSRGYVAGIFYNANHVNDGTRDYSLYGLYLNRGYGDYYSQTNAYLLSGSQNVDNTSAWYGTGTEYGVWLVSDGGTTRSSQMDPSINANNPNAPVNQMASNVPVGGVSLMAFAGLCFAFRRKS